MWHNVCCILIYIWVLKIIHDHISMKIRFDTSLDPLCQVFVMKGHKLLYAGLKNGRIMLYPSASVRLSVRPPRRPSVCPFVRLSVKFFVSV